MKQGENEGFVEKRTQLSKVNQSHVPEKLSGKDVSFVDMTAGKIVSRRSA
jgi:hypothetical protein